MDRNLSVISLYHIFLKSPSSRRAWIEIHSPARLYSPPSVALLAEGVDRNLFPFRLFAVTAKVALLAEGVDRNLIRHMGLMSVLVALLAEGVDRNTPEKVRPSVPKWSPSSRRAWIEIVNYGRFCVTGMVALLAEGVDRNRLDAVQELDEAGRPPRGGRG